ncbi:hypothetical protein J7T55_006950 [Diaporthe amygdali]|uniref:uncharacterized protein n=1 Tax=Phomopsis amygdali TaxID=1214568 RepID=UPI0022FEC3E3|nr:uncharacterized protein J7T55_006950 [Diaporthe amygdali]KAJ0107071.1 hypothetical protein J7T55_006950 [Diaporthe amygdali]
MQLQRIAMFVTLATFTSAAPVTQDISQEEAPLTGRQIASCETQTAATQVACIQGCEGGAACIVSCTATAVEGYISCAV